METSLRPSQKGISPQRPRLDMRLSSFPQSRIKDSVCIIPRLTLLCLKRDSKFKKSNRRKKEKKRKKVKIFLAKDNHSALTGASRYDCSRFRPVTERRATLGTVGSINIRCVCRPLWRVQTSVHFWRGRVHTVQRRRSSMFDDEGRKSRDTSRSSISSASFTSTVDCSVVWQLHCPPAVCRLTATV